MDNSELIVYFIEFIVVGGLFMFFFVKKFDWENYILPMFSLLVSSCAIAIFSAFMSKNGLEFDSQRYLKDAKVIYGFVCDNPLKNIWILFLPGANSFYPSSYFITLDMIDTWTRTSSYMMTKIFSLFSFFNSSNIFSISLYFGLMSFIAKCMLLRVVQLEKVKKYSLKLFYLFLILGGSDILFVGGVYKESIVFFTIVIMVYLIYFNKVKNVLFLVALWTLALLRIEFVLVFIGFYFLNMLYIYIYKSKIYTIIILVISMLLLVFFSVKLGYLNYLINKLDEFSRLQGNTNFTSINSYSILGLLSSLFINFVSVFIRPMFLFVKEYKSVFFLQDGYNVLLILYIILLLFKTKISKNILFLILLCTTVFMIFFISIAIFNFGTIVRYRSIYIVLLVFVLTVYQHKYIVKKNM